jgi:hypothetical protein
MKRRPSIVNTTKPSSHPLIPGRFYTGKIISVLPNGKVSVSIPEIGGKFGPMVPLNLSQNSRYTVGDKIKCTFNNEFFDELIIFGLASVKTNVTNPEIDDLRQEVESLTTTMESLTTTVESLTTTVESLTTTVNSLISTVSTLTSQLNLVTSDIDALELGIWK